MFVYEIVLQMLSDAPNGMTRRDVAERLGVGKTTAAAHLEKLVDRGRAVKTYTHATRSQAGWVYYAAADVVSLLGSAS